MQKHVHFFFRFQSYTDNTSQFVLSGENLAQTLSVSHNSSFKYHKADSSATYK